MHRDAIAREGARCCSRVVARPEQALEFLAHTLTNKLLHAPSARRSCGAAALRGDTELLLRAAEQLYLDPHAGAVARETPDKPSEMNPSIRRKLDELAERHQEVALLLAQPEVLNDNTRFRELSREFAQLDPLSQSLSDYDARRKGSPQGGASAAARSRDERAAPRARSPHCRHDARNSTRN